MGAQEEKENGLWDWANSILNPDPEDPEVVPLIWEAENGTRPDKAFLQLHIISDTPVGTVEKTAVELPAETQTLIGHGDLVLSIQGFGAGSNELLNILKMESEKQASLDFLTSKGFALRNVGPILSVPEIIDETAEKRWNMDVTFGYAWSTTDMPGYILDVEYEGDYIPQP